MVGYFLSTLYVFSQNIDNFKFVDIKEGITKRAVSIIKQDSEGFIWFGTNGTGLYRFDGINYKLYEHQWHNLNSINSSFINSIFEDSTGNFWISTDEGLNLYNREFDNFESIDLNSAFPVNENFTIKIKAIEELNKKELIVGTFGYGGLYRLDKSTLKAKSILFDEKVSDSFLINSIIKVNKNSFYIGSSTGLYFFQFFENGKIIQQKIVNNTSVESLYLDVSNNLWIGTGNDGLFKLSIKSSKKETSIFKITNKRILSISEYNNHIICGTENDGLIIVNKQGVIAKQYLHNNKDDYNLKSNSIWSLLVDKENRIWLGFYNKGVAVVDNLYNKFNAIQSLTYNPNSLKAISVTGIQEDNDSNLWITTDGGGVDFLIKKTGKFVHFNKSENDILTDDIQNVYIDTKQQVWFGSWISGLYKLNLKTKQFSNFSTSNSSLASNRVLTIQEDSKGIIWIGTFLKGLHYLNQKTNKITHCNFNQFLKYELSDADIRRLYIDADDSIWLGTTNGLFLVEQLGNNQFNVISYKDKMSVKLRNHASTHRILSIYQSKDGLIWIGTDGGGLFSFNKSTQNFKWYNKVEGFNELYVSSIIESDDTNIWVSGTGGITKLDRKNNSATNYTKDDGLLMNDFNYNAVLKSKSGELYFGGYEGVNYFHPEKMKKNTSEPKLFFTDFKIFNKSVKPNENGSPLSKSISYTSNITLTNKQSVFTIDYIGLNYTRPEKHQYAYFMEGVDPEWNYVGNSKSATYTNLSPGNYVFNVKVANNDGVWTKKPLKLTVTILPPWYLSNWAYISYFILFIGFIILINWIQQERFKEKQAVKFERDKRLQEEKLNNKKLQFFTNISHEFRTPLTLILNPLNDLLQGTKTSLPYEANEKLKIVQKNAERLHALISELMDFSKLKSNKMSLNCKNVEIINFVSDIVGHFKEEASHRKIDLIFESKSSEFIAFIDKKMIEKVFFNIISNAFKVTPDKGVIIVTVQKLDEPIILKLFNKNNTIKAFEIVVKDTGSGLTEKELTKIFKRFYQVDKLSNGYYGSTGIGLEVVKDFVELHKGEINVSSKEKEGTQFKVILPLIEGDTTIIESSTEESITNVVLKNSIDTVAFDEISVEKRTHTLLIVEDNTELRNYLNTSLKKYYKILTASNGKLGFELAHEKMPDVILTDVVMPEMDGVELCKLIKTTAKTSHIPLLMLSAKSMVEDKIKGIDSGADAYISKPFNMEILKSTLTQLILSRQILFNKFYKEISNKTKENPTSVDNQFMQKVVQYVHAHLSDSNLSNESLAEAMFLSRSQLYRKLKELTGTSVNEFIRNVRLEKAKQLLESKQYSISEVTYKVGFASPSYFTKCFKNKFGFLPTELN